MLFLIFWMLLSFQFAHAVDSVENVILSTHRIELENFPGAFNPSIFKVKEGYLLTFRYSPDPYYQYWISYIGIVLLNDSLEQISTPELLNTRPINSKTDSQAEDARIFQYKDRIFLIYNDNLIDPSPSIYQRRDMFLAELVKINGHFTLSSPLKLVYEEKYHTQFWQKNWTPFEWNGSLFLSYTINPHEILYPNFKTGKCYHLYETAPSIKWDFGTLRGSSPALLIDGEYLSFFHSGIITSLSPSDKPGWHYFMGAYTFSSEPPFTITKMTPHPMMAPGFYAIPRSYKKVIFPGGFVDNGPLIYLAYSRDDCEVWIAKIDKMALKKALKPI
jgi:predicted GH43/DUF377 family glycosyl hydrolase